MTPETGNQSPQARRSIRSRLEESIVWVSLGFLATGIAAGLALAKDSEVLKWIAPKEKTAVTDCADPNAVQSASPVASRWTNGRLIGKYSQVSTPPPQTNCDSCELEIRSVTKDQVAFETNNGVIGSAYLDPKTHIWSGHAQFIPETKGWERTIILVKLRYDNNSATLTLAPNGGTSWDVGYRRMAAK